MKMFQSSLSILLLVIGSLHLYGCDSTGNSGITPQRMTDAMYAVMEADRAVYAEKVVHRLQNIENVIKAKEHWEDEKALPLPAQMFRMGAERVRDNEKDFSYALLSQWPVNKQNKPKTQAEKDGLKFVAENLGKHYYTQEKLGAHNYYTAVYADIAVSQACVDCHNDHIDSPRDDFKLGDVMGGIVIRIRLD